MKHKKEEEMVRRIKMFLMLLLGLGIFLAPLTFHAQDHRKGNGHLVKLDCFCGGDECGICIIPN